MPGKKPSVIFITQNGKVILRDVGWLEKAGTAKSRGQAVFSQSRREAGVRLAGAAAVDENDWGAALLSDGEIRLYAVAALFSEGALSGIAADIDVLDFTAFSASGAQKA